MENYSSSDKIKENLKEELDTILDDKRSLFDQMKQLDVKVFSSI
jgi:hypothetical protein